MTWDEFLNREVEHDPWQVRTTIECPRCGRRIYQDMREVNAVYPLNYRYWCSCGWIDHAPVAWNGSALSAIRVNIDYAAIEEWLKKHKEER